MEEYSTNVHSVATAASWKPQSNPPQVNVRRVSSTPIGATRRLHRPIRPTPRDRERPQPSAPE